MFKKCKLFPVIAAVLMMGSSMQPAPGLALTHLEGEFSMLDGPRGFWRLACRLGADDSGYVWRIKSGRTAIRIRKRRVLAELQRRITAHARLAKSGKNKRRLKQLKAFALVVKAACRIPPAGMPLNLGPSRTVIQPELLSLSPEIPGGAISRTSTIFSWSKVEGPGTVIFMDERALQTEASFSAPGSYILRLQATASGRLLGSGDLQVTVNQREDLPEGGVPEGSLSCNGLDDNLDGIVDNWCKITDRTWPAEYGQAELTLWKDDKLGAVSITIDDNTAPDHQWWLQIGDQYGYRFTWFVVTANLELGGYWGTWDSFRTLLERGHDVQSHTVTHNGGAYSIDEEYRLSKEQIENHYSGHKVLALAYPGSGSVANDTEAAKRHYLGARGVSGVQNKANNINYNQTGSFAAFQWDTAKWNSIINVINYNPVQPRSYRAWECKHFHNMKDSKDAFLQGLDYIKAHHEDFWVGLFREVILFGQERDTAEVIVDSVSNDKIYLRVSDRRNDDLFDYPLSIKVRLNDSWAAFTASQAGADLEAAPIEHDGQRYALVNGVPDRGWIVLARTGQRSITY